MSRLITIVKQLSGRQLTEKEIAMAGRNEKIDETNLLLKYSIKGEEIIVEKTVYQYATTNDASYGSELLHSGYYPSSYSTKTYTLDGKLKSESIINGNADVLMNSSFVSHKDIEYNPSGRFIGKKLKRL